MDTPTEIVIRSAEVPFTVKPELSDWVKEHSGSAYWFADLESIVIDIRHTFEKANRVELYAVPRDGCVYAKIFNDGASLQTEWTLQFTGEGMWFTQSR